MTYPDLRNYIDRTLDKQSLFVVELDRRTVTYCLRSLAERPEGITLRTAPVMIHQYRPPTPPTPANPQET